MYFGPLLTLRIIIVGYLTALAFVSFGTAFLGSIKYSPASLIWGDISSGASDILSSKRPAGSGGTRDRQSMHARERVCVCVCVCVCVRGRQNLICISMAGLWLHVKDRGPQCLICTHAYQASLFVSLLAESLICVSMDMYYLISGVFSSYQVEKNLACNASTDRNCLHSMRW